MSFRKDFYQIGKSEVLLGKNIIVTDNHDWTTEAIVQGSLDRYGIEQQFRASKIRCQLLICVIALTVLRLLEIRVNGAPRESERVLDTPTKTQAEVLRAFGWEIAEGGVLHRLSGS